MSVRGAAAYSKVGTGPASEGDLALRSGRYNRQAAVSAHERKLSTDSST